MRAWRVTCNVGAEMIIAAECYQEAVAVGVDQTENLGTFERCTIIDLGEIVNWPLGQNASKYRIPT